MSRMPRRPRTPRILVCAEQEIWEDKFLDGSGYNTTRMDNQYFLGAGTRVTLALAGQQVDLLGVIYRLAYFV